MNNSKELIVFSKVERIQFSLGRFTVINYQSDYTVCLIGNAELYN